VRWTERQQALLGAMQVRPWPAGGVLPVATAPGSVAPAPAPVPVPVPVPAAAPLAAPPPVDTAVRTLDWPALQAAVAACRACDLCEGRRQTVFGVGDPKASVMLVGEAPGEQEDIQGEPFVGAAGQLLDQILAALGLARGQVYIANTLKCRPPRNRNPQPAELAQCAPFLTRQIELVAPRVIVAMGRFAIDQLLASDAPIGRLRGQVHRWREVPVVVTYHPAYLLRQPADKAKAWADWCLALSLVNDDTTS